MLRFEEPRQQRIHSEEPVARQAELVATDARDTLADERVEAVPEIVEDVRLELPPEIPRVEPPRLELQDHLADQPLVVAHRQRAVDRQFTSVERRDVVFPPVEVLV